MKHFSIFIVLIPLSVFLHAQTTSDTIRIDSRLYLVKLTENTYIHVSYLNQYPCNGLILVENHKAFLFDTPSSDSVTEQLVNYIQGTMGFTLTGFVTNDWHVDSQGGLGYINSLGIPSYSNQMTRQIASSKGLPTTTVGFYDSLHINFENIGIELYYFGAAHTTDNIVAWIPQKQLLFASCMVKELGQNDLGFTGDGDVKAYAETLRKVGEKCKLATCVIPGHGSAGGYNLITHTFEVASQK